LVCAAGDFATFLEGRGKRGALRKLKGDRDLRNGRRDLATVPGGRGAFRPGTQSFRASDNIIECLDEAARQDRARTPRIATRGPGPTPWRRRAKRGIISRD